MIYGVRHIDEKYVDDTDDVLNDDDDNADDHDNNADDDYD